MGKLANSSSPTGLISLSTVVCFHFDTLVTSEVEYNDLWFFLIPLIPLTSFLFCIFGLHCASGLLTTKAALLASVVSKNQLIKEEKVEENRVNDFIWISDV